MFSRLKAAWSRLAGDNQTAGNSRAAGDTESAEPSGAAVDYNGYRIRPSPFRTGSLYQTAGVIEKDFPDGTKAHKFIRAETHQTMGDASEFAVTKGKQIIDQQGDRIFA